jgi:hypothetical protein
VADYRTMFDSEYLGSWDLAGADRTVTIDRVEAGELTGQGGRRARKPIVYFRGKKKGLALNKTNAKVIAALFGADTKNWIGKLIAIYPTRTQFGAEQVDCIRVRPTIPRVKNGQHVEAESQQDPTDPDPVEPPLSEEAMDEREPGQEG